MPGYPGTRWSVTKPCGTDAAYRRHYRRGQKPCQRCIDAHRLAVELREQRRREMVMADMEPINVRVSRPVKRRLDAMQEEMKRALGRQVTVSEVMEGLLAEHDKAMEAESV